MKILAAISALIALSVPALAQEVQEARNAFRRNEFAYNIISYSHQSSVDYWGGDLSYNRNLSDRFSILGELSLHDDKSEADNVRTTVAYRFGPRYVLLQPKHTRIFGEVLAGGSRITDSSFIRFVSGISTTAKESHNGFSFAIGGGVDVPIKPWLTVRAAEVDYSMFQISGNTSNGIRVGTGFVFRFGR
jgi:opacity protein-like surface antigen